MLPSHPHPPTSVADAVRIHHDANHPSAAVVCADEPCRTTAHLGGYGTLATNWVDAVQRFHDDTHPDAWAGCQEPLCVDVKYLSAPPDELGDHNPHPGVRR